jgi:hypothetical protein
LLVLMGCWKVFSELLRPIVGEAGWEFVERASNMVAPFALLMVIRQKARLDETRWHWYAIRPF